MEPNPILLSAQPQACSHPAERGLEGNSSPSSPEQGRGLPSPWGQMPSSGRADRGWFGDEHVQAKRARVETIVRGICLPPSPRGPGDARAKGSVLDLEKVPERKRKQILPVQQVPLQPSPARNQASRKGAPRMRDQLHQLKQQLRCLQDHILQAAVPGAAARGPGCLEPGKGPLSGKQRNGCGPGPWAADSDHHQGSCTDISAAEKHRVSEVQHLSKELRSLPSGAQALLEILKKELTRAVSQAVDSVLQKVLVDPPGHLPQQGRSFQGLVPEGRGEPSPSGGGACRDPHVLALPRRVQPRAGVSLGNFSLAKPLESPGTRSIPRSFQGPTASCPSTAHSHIQENPIASQLLGHGLNGHWSSGPPQDPPPQLYPSLGPALRPWVLSQPFTTAGPESRPLLPSVKTEQGGLQAGPDALPFPSVHIQEGLNPGHLKKAKLMFFFARYPSSNLLKAYFPDVQFSRCITSQMIKWFSNFREFYYIQMEKSARQALSDGVTSPRRLVVLRDSELFRTLNTHYNKGSDFEVPDCFLEVASLTLQEFFRAVSTGKDSDPSWKKPIYKIISKLDSDIPEILKSSSYPQELFQG
ncbi:PREDICTED: prospero homeobox protein 2 [Chinchilla lanigera]|uniref:prospero homeobox protein 2 n=1 Tax=Chinchilla lanigera TaxID=34839 RepID=UPI00038EA5D6|nr:PREDICTED: prospero homeobox protein 2 [Chinchilla lanigera]